MKYMTLKKYSNIYIFGTEQKGTKNNNGTLLMSE